MIDSESKEQMVIEVQILNLKYGERDTKLLVENFREIGKSWKTDGSIGNAKILTKLRMASLIQNKIEDTNTKSKV